MRRHAVLFICALLGACGNEAAPSTSAPATTGTVATTASTAASTTTATVTTTATTISPATTVAAAEPGTIGYIGCSMTRAAVEGYAAVGGTRLWPAYDTAGAAIRAWADPVSELWGRFDEQFAARPPAELWVQVCVFKSGNRFEHLQAAIANLRTRCAECPLRIGWQPEYEPGWECDILGPDGIMHAREIAQDGVDRGLGDPDLSPMGALGASTVDPTDGCHANDAGRMLLGEQLLAYFG